MTIKVDTKDLRDLVDALTKYRKRALPFASRQAINDAAFAARKDWQDKIEREMVLKNQFTKRSIRVDKAKGLRVDQMQAVVGSVADYMRTQELGGSKSARGKHGVPIPTEVATGAAMGKRPQTRAVTRRHRMSAITLLNAKKAGSRKRNNARAIARAKKKGNKFVFLELSERKGIFRLDGGKRNIKVKMVYDLTRKTVRIPRNPTLGPTVRGIQPKLGGLYKRAVIQQLKRHKLLGF